MAYNFCLIADDVTALNLKVDEIKESFQIEDTIQYDLQNDNIYCLIDEMTTISLFDEPKFIIAKGAEELLGKTNQALLELQKAMNIQNSSNILILVFMGNINQNDETFQKLKRFSSVFEVKSKNIKLDEYALNSLKEDGYLIEEDALKLLISYSDSLASLENNLNLLKSYSLATKKITNKEITTMIPLPLDDNVYALIDAVLTNNKKMMIKGYNDLKIRNVQASTLVSLLINKFQELYNVNVLLKNGYNQNTLSELFGVSSGKAYYMVKNAKDYSDQEIMRHLNKLNELDYQIKSGKIEQNIGLELYFLS